MTDQQQMQHQKMILYIDFLNLINISFSKAPIKIQSDFKAPFVIFVTKGNNAALIHTLFRQRWWWTVLEEDQLKEDTHYHMAWTQLRDNNVIEKLKSNKAKFQPILPKAVPLNQSGISNVSTTLLSS